MDSSTQDTDAEAETRAREVEVPLHLYKVVTVFSTMFAVAFVVGGFIVLDTATRRASLSLDEMNLPLAILGVAMIAAGAVVYAFATRFRAEGMGKPKDDSDEPSNNG
jgi:predicted membrane channel-forming protein YqfA (hemolysin III family)